MVAPGGTSDEPPEDLLALGVRDPGPLVVDRDRDRRPGTGRNREVRRLCA
jgi:hypothetical protein